ncbi:MAG: hypothetical protein HYS38_02570 [Acidobacteria bacterium]|nr:hypothetical protein [Acidobacteriota bacterium]
MKHWKSIVSTVLFVAMTSTVARGADASGTWKYAVKNARGTIEQTFVFQQAGNKLSGYIFSPNGAKEMIQDGKVSGDEIKFSVERRRPSGDQPTMVTYMGKIQGDEMKGNYVGPGGDSVEWTAKRENHPKRP